MLVFMATEENIIGSGEKRLRHGTYKTAYRDNHGKDKNGSIRYGFRGEVQTINAGGVVRIRAWFKTYDEARRWLNGL